MPPKHTRDGYRSSESCQVRHDETHSEGEDSDGGEHLYIFRFRLVRVSSSKVIYLHATRPKVQELQHVTNTQVRAECSYAQCVYSF
jgi:hypothetical protein